MAKRLRIGRVTIGIGGRFGLHYTHECPCHRILEALGVFVVVKS